MFTAGMPPRKNSKHPPSPKPPPSPRPAFQQASPVPKGKPAPKNSTPQKEAALPEQTKDDEEDNKHETEDVSQAGHTASDTDQQSEDDTKVLEIVDKQDKIVAENNEEDQQGVDTEQGTDNEGDEQGIENEGDGHTYEETVNHNNTDLTGKLTAFIGKHSEDMKMMQNKIEELQVQLDASNARGPKAGGGGRNSLREWLNDEKVQTLPNFTRAPILLLNAPPCREVSEWLIKRDLLIKKWVSAKMYNPDQTWGSSSTQEFKIQMVIMFFCFVVCFSLFVDVRVCLTVYLCECSVARQTRNWDGRPTSSTRGWSTSTRASANGRGFKATR